MNESTGFIVLIVLLQLIGCSTQPNELSEASSMDRLMATKHVEGLIREIPDRRLTSRIDFSTSEAVHVYLGDDELTHTTRIGFYCITRDGRVWTGRDLMTIGSKLNRRNGDDCASIRT